MKPAHRPDARYVTKKYEDSKRGAKNCATQYRGKLLPGSERPATHCADRCRAREKHRSDDAGPEEQAFDARGGGLADQPETLLAEKRADRVEPDARFGKAPEKEIEAAEIGRAHV